MGQAAIPAYALWQECFAQRSEYAHNYRSVYACSVDSGCDESCSFEASGDNACRYETSDAYCYETSDACRYEAGDACVETHDIVCSNSAWGDNIICPRQTQSDDVVCSNPAWGYDFWT